MCSGRARGREVIPLRNPNPAVIWAQRRMRTRPVMASVADLAAQIEWSRRHFELHFRHQVGLPPHTVARILRFERALTALADNRGTLAEVAARAGYSDHAHFARDVRARTGSTPSRLVIAVHNADAALEFYQRAFGARLVTRLDAPDGQVLHAELRVDDSAIVVPERRGDDFRAVGVQGLRRGLAGRREIGVDQSVAGGVPRSRR
jgi:AraC-like DNA-binding protein